MLLRFIPRPSITGWHVLLVATMLLSGCGDEGRGGEAPGFSGPTMGTTYTVRYTSLPAGVTQTALQKEVDSILADITRQMSTYDPASVISQFNRSPADVWVPVSADFIQVVEEAIRISRLSDGAFDITVGPLLDLWGFGPQLREDRVPSPQEISRALRTVGYGYLRLRHQPPALMKTKPGVKLDLNAIAPGFAADRVAAQLSALGMRNYLVDMGGELRLSGHNNEGQPWTIAVEKPVSDSLVAERVIQLTGKGISTSGDYNNYFEINGVHYSHEIDPRVGMPIAHTAVSVTAVASTAMTADALSTALLVMGPSDGYTYAMHAGIPALFVLRQPDGYRELPTPAFRPYMRDRMSLEVSEKCGKLPGSSRDGACKNTTE